MKNFTPSAESFDRYMDASVELFMECYAETIIVNKADECPAALSPSLQEKCKMLIKSTKRRQNRVKLLKRTGRFLKSAAVIAIAFLSLSSFLFMTVEAVRKPVMKFYIQKLDGNWLLRGSTFDADPNAPESACFIEQDPLGALLPEEFHLHSIEGNQKENLTAVYCNDDQEFVSFRSVCSDSNTHINTENADVERLKIGEYDAVLSVRRDTKAVILKWYNSDLEIIVTMTATHLSKEELIHIAQEINQQLMH